MSYRLCYSCAFGVSERAVPAMATLTSRQPLRAFRRNQRLFSTAVQSQFSLSGCQSANSDSEPLSRAIDDGGASAHESRRRPGRPRKELDPVTPRRRPGRPRKDLDVTTSPSAKRTGPVDRAPSVSRRRASTSQNPVGKTSRTKTTAPSTSRTERPARETSGAGETPAKAKEAWQIYKEGLKNKFGDTRWDPKKKVSPDAMEGIRAMHAQYPDHFTTPVLAQQFGLSPDAIRRILKSKWKPSADEEEERRARWDKRGERIWRDLVDEGMRPPKRWRMMGIGSGPRRPGQDRQLQKAMREGTARHPSEVKNEWIQSLAQRMG